MVKAEIAKLLEKDSPFTLKAAQFILGFQHKSEISDLHELVNGWASFKRDHRHFLLHGFLEGLTTEEMVEEWYAKRTKRPLPIPSQQLHKVRNEIFAKTKRYVIRLVYLRLRKGTYQNPYTGEKYPPLRKREANQVILKEIISPSDKCLGQASIRLATSKFLFEENY